MRAIFSWVPRLVSGLAAFLSVAVILPAAYAGTPTNIVIAQVYGAGGLSGANYRQDFITLFNPTASAITANSWAIQIRSSTSTAAFTVYQLPNFTLQPGQYYLITGSSPTLSSYGAVLPVTADYLLTSQFPGPASSSLNILSSTTQTIALTSSTTPIPSGDSGPECPALTASNLVDVIGYGATNCFEGGNPAPDFSTIDFSPSGYTAARSTSLSRINPCVDNYDNSIDFVVTPLTAQSFQNSSTTPTPCPATQLLAVAAVSPEVVYPGSPVLFTAVVTPSTGPSGTITSVTMNLQGIGGSTTQTMYDDGTHGDAVAGDGTYSYSATVSTTAVAGTHVSNVTVTDNHDDRALAPATFVVTTNEQMAAIHTVQTGAPTNSENNGVVFTVSGIVTGVRSRGFYLQEPDSEADSDPTTSEAIYVNTGVSAPPSSVVVGNEIQVTGVLTVVPALTSPTSSAAPYYGTELDAPIAYSVLSTGNPMPTPITIAPEMAAAGSIYGQRYQYQSMLVSVPSVTAISGTSGTLTESTEMYTSDGRFYGVVQGTPRPFREPGLNLADPIPSGAPDTVQNFDGNPEALSFDSTLLGGTPIDVTTGTTVSGVVAIDDYSSGAEQLLISATARPTVGTLNTSSGVPQPDSSEFTVGTQSMQRFYSSVPTTGAVTLIPEAYQRRLAKSSLSIRKSLGSPDILAMQEVGTIASLTDLANKINSDAVSSGDTVQPGYTAYLTQGNDAAAVNNGFLVDANRITVNSVTQVDKTTTFTDASGNSAILFDDPPLVLDATVNATSNTAAYPVLVLSVEFATPAGQMDTTTAGQTLRIKRQQQAQTIAGLVQSYQGAGKNVVVAGNFGAPEFSDGVVDVVGIVDGMPTASANVVLGASNTYTAPSPALVDLTPTATGQKRYSQIHYGSAEAVDHIIVTSSLAGGYMIFAHDNVDFPVDDRNDATRPERNSDHDGAVGYFALPDITPTSSASITPSGTQDFGDVPVSTASQGQVFTFTNTGNTVLSNITVGITGDFVQTNNCSATLAPQNSCGINVTFTPTVTGIRSGTLTVTSSSTADPILSVSLTGTGTTAPVATLALTPASEDFGAISLNTASSAGIFLLTNTGQAAITGISIATSGDYSETTSCGSTLAPCSSCSINVVFTPTASGNRSGKLTVTSNSTATPSLVSTLTGQGLATLTTTASVAPTAEDFGTVNVGAISSATTFTFTNTGTSSMTGISVGVTGDFAETNTCGYFLNPAANCTISITFSPTSAGMRSGTLNITSGSILVPSITSIATLTGTGYQATNGASLSPSSKDLGAILLGTSSSTANFVFTNIGNTSLTSVAVAISGSGFSQTNNCPATVAAGASCTVGVVFTPGSVGSASGTLTITSSSTTNPTLTAALTATGAAATSTATLTPTSQDFGSVTVGATSADYNFNFANTGNTAINGVTISVSGPFQESTTSSTGGDNCPATMDPGTSCTIILTFNPTTIGSLSGALTVTSSSTTDPTLSSTLTGMGIGTGEADSVFLSPASQDFGSVAIGSVSPDIKFTFTNTGTSTVSNVSVSMTGPFKSGGSSGTTCTSTLAAGASCTIDLVFAPTTAGSSSGVLTVTSSSSTSPAVTATLTGTGTVEPAFNLTASTTTATIASGSPVTFSLSAVSTNGYAGALNLSCTGAPTYSSCQVTPASVTMTSNGTSNLSVYITTSSTTASLIDLWLGPLGWLGGLSCALLLLAGKRGRRLFGPVLLLCVGIILIGSVGCGGGTSAGNGGGSTTHSVSPGTYTYTITATDGTLTKTLPFTVTVQ